jgi:hypothetical protein
LCGEQCVDIRGGGAETEPAKGQGLTSVPVSEQPEVTDLDEAGRQDMEQEASDELDCIELS